MTTVSNVSTSNISGYNVPATSTGGVAVVQTADAGLTQAAVDLASAGNIVASLGGGSSSSSSLTYDAAGLLNSFTQAGVASPTAPVASGSFTSQAMQSSTDQAIISTLPSSPVAAGVYNSSGTLQGLPSNTTTSWANALKDNPGLAASVISDSFNQGIVGTLSTTA